MKSSFRAQITLNSEPRSRIKKGEDGPETISTKEAAYISNLAGDFCAFRLLCSPNRKNNFDTNSV